MVILKNLREAGKKYMVDSFSYFTYIFKGLL